MTRFDLEILCDFKNSILFGDIKIGNNVMIGANATLTKSFDEDNILIAGSPAQIIKRL